jgi:peptidoglycan/LPS O-acetylase OafA/YrhL
MPGLDGLRAIAVLGVIAFHLGLPFAQGGLLGVGVFFVLSGYLISDILIGQWERRGAIDLKDFWLRRARRLLPALFVLLLAVSAYVTVVQPSELGALRSEVAAAALYVSNWWYIFHHVSYFASFGPPSPLTHLWSLAVEEQFYLLWPGLLWLGLRFLPRRGLLLATLLLAAASATAMGLLFHGGSGPDRVYYGTDTRAFALLIGGALAQIFPSRRLGSLPLPARRLIEGLGGVGLLAILLMFWTTNEYEAFLYPYGLLILSLATAGVVAAAVLPDGYLAKFLGMEPLRWLGVRSYGIYLWHYPVITLTASVGLSGFSPLRMALQVSVSIALAALSWRYVEEPIRHGALQRMWRLWRQHALGRRSVSAHGIVTACATGLLSVVACLGLVGIVPTAAASSTMPEVTSILPTAPLPRIDPAPNLTVAHVVLPRKRSAETTPPSPPTVPPSGASVTAIGDSVMIDAAPYLQRLLPGITIDAVVGRQLYQTPAVIAQLKAHGQLGSRVILELGNNGPYTRAQLLSLLRSLGGAKEILLINTRVPRPWQDQVNRLLASVAKTYPGAVLVDWYDASAGHAKFFYADGVHLDPEGASFYASLVAHTLVAHAQGPRPSASTSR